MQNSQRFWRGLFFILLITALCGGLALPAVSMPARAAPKMQAATNIVISEFRTRGSSATDEFVELYNPTNGAINIGGWTIRKSSGCGATATTLVTIPTGVILNPGQHYLSAGLSYSGTTTPDFQDTGNWTIADSGGVAVLDSSSAVIDQVGMCNTTAYLEGSFLAPMTGTTDQSYERQLDISGSCTDSNNNATDFFLRSPSDPQNSSSPITTCGNPTSTPSPTSTATTTDTPTSTGTATGTGAPTNTATATSTAGPIQTVLINEVAWAGTVADPNDEWIELHNPSSTATVDLTGWVLKSSDNTPNIPLTGSIGPEEFLVFAKNAGTFQPPVSYTVNNTINLSNNGEILTLIDSGGRTIDTANSDGGTWPAGIGSPTYASMERLAYINQWITYGGTIPIAHDRGSNPIKGTPGKPNWIDTTTITTITSDAPDPSVVNRPVTVTVSVVGGTIPPTGTISITGANSNCTINLSNSTSCIVNFTFSGTKTLTATYGGDSTHPPSSDMESHQVSNTPVPTPTKFRTATPKPLPPPPLVAINEFVPRPGHDWNNDGLVNQGDEYIEILNHGVIDVNLSGYSLDDEVNVGSTPYRLPSITLKPGERHVFYGSETGLLLSDGGDAVRLLKPNGQLADAYNYTVARYPDEAYCRLPDNGGLDDWNQYCFPTPGLQNSLSGGFPKPPTTGVEQSLCPIADTLPEDFVLAECLPFGNNIWNSAYWDKFGWFDEQYLPGSPGKWPLFGE
ncbi:MAG TPA: lamin tail domain-containing protein [Anaerolineales bacterium]|nr:lamin tail domain-containing protein [Anaerolineales bacterium]